jgi:hypothetical protein
MGDGDCGEIGASKEFALALMVVSAKLRLRRCAVRSQRALAPRNGVRASSVTGHLRLGVLLPALLRRTDDKNRYDQRHQLQATGGTSDPEHTATCVKFNDPRWHPRSIVFLSDAANRLRVARLRSKLVRYQGHGLPP